MKKMIRLEKNKYSSIKYINKIEEKIKKFLSENGIEDTMFVVTEKVHGANVSFEIDSENNVKIRNRTFLLETEEDMQSFYQIDKLYNYYKDKMIKLKNNIEDYFDIGTSKVTVYGEYFGGFFLEKLSDEEKKILNKSVKIQTGIQYVPFNDFIIFDISVELSNGEKGFLDYDLVKEIVEKTDDELKVVPELFRGNFEECLNYPNNGLSIISEIYGYGLIENNQMEGVVIKSIKDIRMEDNKRLILKNKNPKFEEIIKKNKKKVPKIQLEDNEKQYIELLSNYINNNRLDGLFGKGIVSTEDPVKKIAAFLVEDALNDFIEDYPDFNNLEKKKQKYIKKKVTDYTVNLIERAR